jgi:hypothetical protein
LDVEPLNKDQFRLVADVNQLLLYTPVESMPDWAQVITKFKPVAYFIEVMRMIVIKGRA